MGVVHTLLAAGAYSEVMRADGSTPLHVACQYGYIGVVEALIEAGVDIMDHFQLGEKVVDVDLSSADIIGRSQDDIKAQRRCGASCLHVAAQKGHVEVIRIICRHLHTCSTNVPESGLAPIGWINKGSPVAPLYLACQQGKTKVAKVLIKYSADVNEATDASMGSNTPLLVAAQNGRLGCVRLLLESGADVNLSNNEGVYPALLAAAMGHDEIFRHLKRCNACTQRRTRSGVNPIFLASMYGHLPVLECIWQTLLYSLDEANYATEDGTTPLLAACLSKHVDIAKFLLKNANGKVHALNKAGLSPINTSKWAEVDKELSDLLHGPKRTSADRFLS